MVFPLATHTIQKIPYLSNFSNNSAMAHRRIGWSATNACTYANKLFFECTNHTYKNVCKVHLRGITCGMPAALYHSWAHVKAAPPDPILGLNEKFMKDTSPQKVNLGVGAYRDEYGSPWSLPSTQMAEAARVDTTHSTSAAVRLSSGINYEYLPIEGDAVFVKHATDFAYGKNLKSTLSVAAFQSVSGTGAIRIAAEWLKRYHPADVLIPLPSWPNHVQIFEDSNFNVKRYRYWDQTLLGINLENVVEDLSHAADQSIVILHACAHNPTGCDPTHEQWKEIEKIIKKKNHLVLMDMAYQGFASGNPDSDAWAVRYFVEMGHKILLCQSFAKNMGLYGHRLGVFSFLCEDENEKQICTSQMKRLIRSIYSSPPKFGSEIAKYIFENESARIQWSKDLKSMSGRVQEMRLKLYSLLKDKHQIVWDHVMKQSGMFAYTGLNAQQVTELTDKYHIYMAMDGRISVAGLNSSNVEYVADSIACILKS